MPHYVLRLGARMGRWGADLGLASLLGGLGEVLSNFGGYFFSAAPDVLRVAAGFLLAKEFGRCSDFWPLGALSAFLYSLRPSRRGLGASALLLNLSERGRLVPELLPFSSRSYRFVLPEAPNASSLE